MKWINPGIAELLDGSGGDSGSVDDTLGTYKATDNDSGYFISFPYKTYGIKNLDKPVPEVWFESNVSVRYGTGEPSSKEFTGHNALCAFFTSDMLQAFSIGRDQTTIYIKSHKRTSLSSNFSSTILYSVLHTFTPTIDNIEVHLKLGESGRVDVWWNTKLIASFRSPSAFLTDTNISSITLGKYHPYLDYSSESGYKKNWCYSSIIIQDTRRIGLEKFKKLTIDPDTEQNMPQGSTTTYKLSGLSDATEFSDITSVCAVLQATSRDANISTGTFSLEGADVGTIDVSDSSGRAYEIAHAETNSLTGKPWTRDDIEGKTLSFKVNGAS